MYSGNSLAHADVVLVTMPFSSLFQPSIGLSLLKAGLTRRGITSVVLYESLQLVSWIGKEAYIEISDVAGKTGDLVGEWIFAESLFGDRELEVEGYIRDVLQGTAPEHQGTYLYPKPIPENTVRDLLSYRKQVSLFLEHSLARVTSYHPRIVGFTSSIQQHLASLSLAKKIKSRYPDIFIVFGGANLQGEMGLETIKQFPFVDAVVLGEGDIVFPEMVERLLNGFPLSSLSGVITRNNLNDYVHNEVPEKLSPSVIRNMDDLPYPDYDDFFNQWSEVNAQVTLPDPRLLIETSRGCWWGQRSHCTFCGLNGATLTFRSKSPQRALDEILYLYNRYGKKYSLSWVSFVDNILPMNYFDSFLPALSEMKLGWTMFYEVKANLKKEQVLALKRAGVTMIQPGIESLSNQVLNLMRKGVTRLQNVQILKWCEETGVRPFWNLLYGFANEDPQEYTDMENLIPLLEHLPPPMASAPIRMDRFSPNFMHAEMLGYTNVRPLTAYRYIYPFSDEVVYNLAYYFTYDYQKPRNVRSYVSGLEHKVTEWQNEYKESGLFFVDKTDQLLIFDLRSKKTPSLFVARDPLRTLYLLCDKIQSVSSIKRALEQGDYPELTANEIKTNLYKFVEKGLMLEDDGKYLSLATSIKEYHPRKGVLKKLMRLGIQLEPVSDEVVLSAVDLTVG